MAYESDLVEFSSKLSKFIDKPKILESNSAATFFSDLNFLFDSSPPSLQVLIKASLSEFVCFSCRFYMASKFLPCGHSACPECLSRSSKCLCGSNFPPDQNFQGKCGRCRGEVQHFEVNCEHYCGNCVSELVSTQLYQCNICGVPFDMLSYSGICTKCYKQPVSIVLICTQHAHCENCSVEDLRNMHCSECGPMQRLNEKAAARISDRQTPMCEQCRYRKNKDIIVEMMCCGKKYCVMCLEEQAGRQCFCGVEVSGELANCLQQVRGARECVLRYFAVGP
jgi:hypothetical protein